MSEKQTIGHGYALFQGMGPIIIPIPLSGNHIITIHNIPHILPKLDAEKICRVIMALSTESII